MKRETLIASILGISLGAVVAGGILFRLAGQGEDKNVIANQENSITPTVIVEESEDYEFRVEAPENDIVVNEETTTIRGTATAESLVTIQSPTDQQIFTATEEPFEVSFPLSIGENVIVISFYPPNVSNVYEEKELHIYYMPE
jgi:hypothetical protein